MSHSYISFPFPAPAGFADRYAQITGETLQNDPPVNAAGTRCLVGSARLTGEHREALLNDPDYGAQITIGDDSPAGWVPAGDEP